MKVKLCARCPYTPRDLAGHYDPEATLHVCAKCDGEQGVPTKHYPREAQRRRKCSTVHSIFGMEQRSAAPSVTEGLVSSGTTPGELRSVPKSALIGSGPAGNATAHGCSDFKQPESYRADNHGETSAVRHFGTRRLRVEASMQTPLVLLSLLPVANASPSGRSWTDCSAPPSSSGSAPAREVLFNVAHAR